MAVNYEEKRADALAKNQAAEKAALNEVDVNYGNMIADTDKAYQSAIDDVGVRDANGNWNKGSMAQIQTDQAKAELDFAIDEIERNKQQAHKDYIKEQQGAYHDWQKQSDPYGVDAEQKAAAGLGGAAGYLASVQERYYNTYQNRVATARASYDLVVQKFDSDITNARLQNSATLAEIALNALQKGLELSLKLVTEKNQLIADKAQQKLQVQQIYQSKWQDALDQINRNEEFAWQKEQAEIENKRQQAQLEIAQGELKLAKDKFAYEKIQNAKAALKASGGLSGGKVTGGKSKWYAPTSSSKKTSKTIAGGAKQAVAAQKQNKAEAESFINDAIKAGKSKDEISRIISQARTDGAITEKQALDLLNKYCPKGLQY